MKYRKVTIEAMGYELAPVVVTSTELARKMVREWGMSSRVGPMAWGSQGQVFLGEDLMHTRDYSDDTARVIDEEVERILREAQERCRETLTENRHGLDLVARALLEHETIDGTEVTRLLELARAGSTSANPHSMAASAGPSGNGGDAVVQMSATVADANLQAVEKVLSVLAEMPAPEPPADLATRTLARVAGATGRAMPTMPGTFPSDQPHA